MKVVATSDSATGISTSTANSSINFFASCKMNGNHWIKAATPKACTPTRRDGDLSNIWLIYYPPDTNGAIV
jgi:hypothetical protein